MNASTETSPLLPTAQPPSDLRPRPSRNVTFDPNPDVKTIDATTESRRVRDLSAVHRHASLIPSGSSLSSTSASSSGSGPPVIAALNSKLKRRNSHGTPSVPTGTALILPSTQPKIGPQRSTKNAQKLKLLPNPEIEQEEVLDEETGKDVYSQYTRIKDPSARRDAARLGKADRDRLPRVTAYCTANRYQMDGLMRFLKGRGKTKGANPKLIDECIYTPYSYRTKHFSAGTTQRKQPAESEPRHNPAAFYERRHSTGQVDRPEGAYSHEDSMGMNSGSRRGDSADDFERHASTLFSRDLTEDAGDVDQVADFDIEVHTPEVFLFEYGVVVIWGMTLVQEQKFLKEISKFEIEKLAPDDVETEYFNFYYTREYQARIYNDFIALRDKNNYMTKLAISHALAQSVKTSLFEELIASTIDACKDIPTQIALTGKIALSRSQINMQIGELFILRISIHLNGSILDTPELFWVEPQLEPVYQAVRSYLEMDQRVGLLTERLDVIADLLAVLKDQLSHGHGEKLEWIVIILIAAEILVAAVNIVVDLYAGVD
ncbi:hypothetical protein VTK73DRAFT_4162 [Phialemonium thermophilum]|uniref:DUF155 domain-containing protein n=1 Tax=Phialemonium thermophilum TaxID=223376 RepID=A0ABR3XZE5_9PEZI